MYHEFYGFREAPFSLLPDPDFIYPTTKHETAFSVLELAMENGVGFSVVSGEIGAGKTTLIRLLLASLQGQVTVGLVSNTHSSFGSLMEWISEAFGLDSAGKSAAELNNQFADFLIEQYRIGAQTLLIIDEAQNLSAETLEELRLISNINSDKDQLLQTILVGQPNLRHTLQSPELEQFAQRIGADFHLEGLDSDETAKYIRYRVEHAGGSPELFTDEACVIVHEQSNGIPRRINLLCDTALVYAYGESNPHVDAEVVQCVVQDRAETTISRGISSMSGAGPAERLDKLMPDAHKPVKPPAEPKPPEDDVSPEIAPKVAPAATETHTAKEARPAKISAPPLTSPPFADLEDVQSPESAAWGRRLDGVSMLLVFVAVALLWEIRHELGF